MSRFYSEAYKWSLYEKYRAGFSLTEICEISGITDKPLREWFRRFDMQYAQANQISISSSRIKIICLAKQVHKDLPVEKQKQFVETPVSCQWQNRSEGALTLLVFS